MTSGFTVSDIREQFVQDTALMLDETVKSARDLLRKKPGPLDKNLAVIKRHGHSLRGLASLVNARGLEAWGADVEHLAAEAESTASISERKSCLLSIVDNSERWLRMNSLSAVEDHDAAWSAYEEIRSRIPDNLRKKLPPVKGALASSEVAMPRPVTPVLMAKAAPILPIAAPATPVLMEKKSAPPPIAAPVMPALKAKQNGVSVAPSPVMPALKMKHSSSSPAVSPVMPALKSKAAPAASPKPEMDMELLGFFLEDAEDQIRTLERATLRWEQLDDPEEQRAAVRRAFHTLKGAANSVGLTQVGKEFHRAEDFIEGIADGRFQVSLPLFQFLLGTVDQLRGFLSGVKAGRTDWTHDWSATLHALETTSPQEIVSSEPDHIEEEAAQESTTIRVDSARVARLGSLLSEIVTDRRRVENRLEQIRAVSQAMRDRASLLHKTVNTFQKQFEFNLMGQQKSAPGPVRPDNRITGLRGAAGEFSELEFDRYDEASILARSLAEVASDFDQLLGEWAHTLHEMEGDASQFKQTSREVQNAVSSLSLVAFDELGPRLQRVFRDALGAEQKEGRLEFSGQETLLDKSLVERVYPALLHLVRNAVAHGLESPEARAAAGKDPLGRVRITCAQVANQIVIRVEDDGFGIDEPAIRIRAFEKGLLNDASTELRSTQILRIVCHSGFSTAETVTDVAGRGVGMDVARSEIEALKGALDVSWQPGAGTTWTIRLPLTLSITEGVILSAGGAQYALPMNAVLGGILLSEAQIETGEDGQRYGTYNGERLPVIGLAHLLNPDTTETAEYGLAVSSLDKKAILAVRRLLGRAELPMKPLDAVTAVHPLFESATIDPQGVIVPVLSAASVMSHASTGHVRRAEVKVHAEVTSRPSVLVVDDSVSVRRVQQRMLESLGCDVIAANDGLHALDCLRERSFHMILTDLEMPRLNGYELIAEIRSNPAWSATPVIVISSRSADKYVAKAMNLGATSFLFKPFTEAQISALLNHHLHRLPAAA